MLFTLKRSLFSILCIGLCASVLTVFAADDADNNKLPLSDLQRYATVIETVKKYYVKPITDAELIEYSLKGMLAGLDPHSAYLDEEDYASLKSSNDGKFGGLGVEVIPEDGLIRVISAIDDTPAQRAGVQAGDIIIRLNGTLVRGLSVRDTIEKMRGEKGTPVTLTIIRQGAPKPINITVIRDTINVKSVKSETLEPGFGYIRVSQFQTNTGDEFIQALQSLKKENNKQLKGLVLDLRGNPGGLLETCVQVADALLDRDKLKYDGVIVYAKGQMNSSQIKEKAHGTDALNGAPIVVLVNGGSASGSEIVAGALQDHHRAIVMGTQSFGKGSVQTVMPLNDNRGLKLTTALYYTPAGRSIQAEGITPDIIVDLTKIPVSDNDQKGLLLKEEDLKGHLENGGKPEDKKNQTANAKDKNIPLINRDYQLFEALNVLKGLALKNASA